MQDFKSLGLPAELMQALERMQFNTPTPIQAQAIPPALEGKDVLGSAQTGTGKTGAFGIPLLTRLMNDPRSVALVMTPTRELAIQVMDALKGMGAGGGNLKTALVIGGESMPKQIQALRGRPRVIVGTPGRINDHLARGTMMLANASFLVLDEMDRMLDMGFAVQIDKVIKYLPKVRQTLMFSATLPPNILKLSEKYLHHPVRVSVGSTTKPIEKIQQEVIHLSQPEKYDALCKELDKREGSVIVFVKTKRNAQRIADKLYRSKYSADAVHGDLQQRKRERVIESFRAKKSRILIATDIVARGLDIPHIEHVINYDLPQCPEDYIHRIGRTARNGAEGSSVCFVSPEDALKWREITRLMDPNAKPQGGEARQGNNNNRSRNRSNNKRRGKFHGKDNNGRGNNEYPPKGNGRRREKGDGENRGENRGEQRGENRNEKRGEGNRKGGKPFRFKRHRKGGNKGANNNASHQSAAA